MADLITAAYLLFGAGKYSNAYDIFFDLSIDGNAEATYCVGYMHLNGLGVKEDLDKAVDFYQQAVEQGFVPACADLADIAVLYDEKFAFRLFSQGARSGDQYAMNRLSKFYDEGIGTRADPRKGDMWYEKSNETGDVPAMVSEGVKMVIDGNYIQARIFMMRAAVMGNPLAAAVVGRMYREGIGVKKDEETAGVWSDIAFAYGWNENDPEGYLGLKGWFEGSA